MSSLVLSSVGLKDHVSLPAYLHGEQNEEEEVEMVRKRNGFRLEEARQEEEEKDTSETSSIGAESSFSSSEKEGGGGGGEEEEEVESKKREGAFGSLNSLEERLPIKRGLSNFFSGKSKSFASLSDAANANVTALAKPENPFNKRRRILMAYKVRRASYNSLTYLPPLVSPDHTVDEEDEEEDGDRCSRDLVSFPPLPSYGDSDHRKVTKKAFRSPRSFSLSDLRHA